MHIPSEAPEVIEENRPLVNWLTRGKVEIQDLQEPVQDEEDIIKFYEETGLPVALDETIENVQENSLGMLAKFTHSGVVVVVLKPSVVGGFENAALIARWAQQQGKMGVVSATFESSLGLSAYVQFSYYLELQKASICMAMNKEPSPSIEHGLGNYGWLKEDITVEPLNICRNPCSGFIEASVDDAGRLLGNFQVDNKIGSSNEENTQFLEEYAEEWKLSNDCSVQNDNNDRAEDQVLLSSI